MKRKKTLKNYEQWLNETMGYVEDYFGGKFRRGMYGTLTRKHDPIGFRIGFNEWKLEK